MSRLCVCACLVVLTTAVVASADLGAVTWSGGTLRLLDDHPTISLTSEKLHFGFDGGVRAGVEYLSSDDRFNETHGSSVFAS